MKTRLRRSIKLAYVEVGVRPTNCIVQALCAWIRVPCAREWKSVCGGQYNRHFAPGWGRFAPGQKFSPTARYTPKLHTKFHHRTTSNKKDQKFGSTPKTVYGPGTTNRFLINLLISHVGYWARDPRFQIWRWSDSFSSNISKSTKNGVRAQKRAIGRNSKFSSDSHTPGHLEYLHTKFHYRTTSNKKDQKFGSAPKTIYGPGTKNRFLINLIVSHVRYWARDPRFQIQKWSNS